MMRLSLRFRRRVAVPIAVAVLAAASGVVVWLSGDDPARRPSVAGPPPSASVAPPSAVPPDPPSPAATTPAPTLPPATASDPQRQVPTPTRTAASAAPRPRPGSSSPRPAQPTPPPPPQAASLDDLMNNDGLPPDGVASQVNFFLGGGGECAEEVPGKPNIDVAPVVEIPSVPTLCLNGFSSGRTVTVTVTSPGSTRTQRYRQWDPLMGVTWLIPPGSPPGRYTVRAVQGSRKATASFDVRRASKPRLWINPRTVHPGEPVDVYIGGFPPSAPADLHLYATHTLRYRATLTVDMDRNGEAHLVLQTSRSGPFDAYALNSPLIYIPPPDFEPGETDGPNNSVFWLLYPTGQGSGKVAI